jgi:hypothetical protein
MEKDDWQQKAHRFVAFFDIMGFKDLVQRKGHSEIIDILYKLSHARNRLESGNNFIPKSGKTKFGETRSFTFSDSIIFFSKAGEIEDINKITVDCLFLLRAAFQNQIPIKGAVSFGEITLDKSNSIYFGQPIIDAFQLHEELLLYSVIADHSFEKQAEKLKADVLEKQFEFYETPLKSGKSNHNILKPVPQHKEEIISNVNKLYRSVSGKPRQYIDNTLEFLNKVNYKNMT